MSIDVQDLRLEAQSQFGEIVTDFMKDLATPMTINALALRWMTLPMDQKEGIKQVLPKTYERIMQAIK
jgi:hypothetical protein